MTERKKNIESIIEGMSAIRRKFIMKHSAKGAKLGGDAPITPSQWMALAIVMKKESSVGIKDIAQALGITSSAATQLVDGLVDKGYLVRGSAKDRRALSLTLSDKHKKKIQSARAEGLKRFTVMFGALTDKEVAQYAALNKKIADRISNK